MNLATNTRQLQLSALLELGKRYESGQQLDEAIDLYRGWLTSWPNEDSSLLIWYEFGRLLQKTGEHAKAENAFRSALEKKRDFHQATLALGMALESQGKIDEAIAIWQAAIPPQALQVDLLKNIARLLEQSHRVEETEQVLIDSLKLNNLQEEVITTLVQQRQKLCRWPVISSEINVPQSLQRDCIGPLASLALFDDPAINLAAAKRFLEAKSFIKTAGLLSERGQLYPKHDRIRVGFLSADFRLHATSIFFVSLIEKLDREKFEVYALDVTTTPDPFVGMRQRLLKAVDHHLELQSLNDLEAATLIRDAEIDVLIDMSGLTAGARPNIVAYRPAPLQISYIGFLASCGIPTIDYIMTTRDLFPARAKKGFTEKPLYLPGMYFTLDAERAPTQTLSRKDCNLPEEAIVYCALLNSFKITPDIFACWMRILKGVPDSVLWLVEENPTTRKNLESHAEKQGIDPGRLRFSQRVHPDAYRQRLALADLFLDTSPYGNGATAHDAVLANLPILTKPGKTMMSRVAAHIMTSVGVGDLVAPDLEQYEKMAIELGHDKGRLAAYRQTIQESRASSPLFDSNKFVKEFGDTILHAVKEIKATQPT